MTDEETPVQEVKSEQPVEKDGLAVAGDDELSKLAVAKALGFNKITDLKQYQDQVDRLVNWAQLNGDKSLTGIVSRISELKNQVGPNKSIYELSVLAGLELERAKLDKEISRMKGPHGVT